MTNSRRGKDLPERLWTADETASFLVIPKATLYQLNHKGNGPRFFRVGKHCRYDPRDVFEWLRTRSSVPA